MADIYTHGMWTTHPGREEEFFKTWKELSEDTMRNIEGAEQVWMIQDLEKKNLFFSFGSWVDVDAVQRFRDSDGFKASFEKMGPLLENFEIFTGEVRFELQA